MPEDNQPEDKKADEPKDTPAELAEETKKEKPAKNSGSKSGWHHKLWAWAVNNKKFSIPIAVVTVLLILFIIPVTRYAIAGLFWKQDFKVTVLDSQTNKPVSGVTVALKDKTALTDNKGNATLNVAVGYGTVTLSKKYYKQASQDVTVTLVEPEPLTMKFVADGRQVPVKVLNKISGQALANAVVAVSGSETKTDKNGQATIVLPANKTEEKGTVTAQGYNKTDVTIKVTASEDPANTFTLTPSGKIYFLSNATGKLDVVKSDLDGSNRQTVLPGTGKEDKNNTVLLASRDWKYIALLSKRDGGENAKLFLIEADTDKLTTMDEGKAEFTPYGWVGDKFVYKVNRLQVNAGESKRQALKSYSASAKKITLLDETTASGDQNSYVYEDLGTVIILDQEITYPKNWFNGGLFYNNLAADRQATFNSVKADGTQKKVVKNYPKGGYSIDLRTGDFGEIYIQYYDPAASKYKFDQYENGKVSASNLTESDYYSQTYPVYSVSPSGKKTLWSDFRDGKNVIFVGDSQGQNGKEIGSSEDFNVYGWFTDDYVLLTKKGSEMRIMPAEGLPGGLESSLKITNYYKPNYYRPGFGYGYGG